MAIGLLGLAAPLSRAISQDTTRTGSIAGRVTDEAGAPIVGAQVFIQESGIGTLTRNNGDYLLGRVPVGTQSVRARIIGYRMQVANVTVTEGQRATQNFSLVRDPLALSEVVVTATTAPRANLESSVAVTTLTPDVIEQSNPRSTTEVLRYVPGFTRVESSGGEVNENITMRGILGVEYVNFMEDGMPVFPTMHTFFMNADNLFRPDENIERVEVVRGGASALFGSNTPGAIVNFINKTGGDQLSGVVKGTAGTQALARYDFNLNGPFGDDWRFNVGGFYRYDHGVRDPGFPGIRGGQLKGNVTRLLDNGYVRASFKYIDDRNQFILPLPFTDPGDPEYVPGFSNYGSMNTNEGLGIIVPLPTGQLELPLANGLRTRATWLTADAAFEFGQGWRIQNAAQAMQNQQQWNAIVPSDVMTVDQLLATSEISSRIPAGYTPQLLFTNHPDAAGNPTPFDTPNGLVSPGGEWHVEKPLTAFQDQIQLTKAIGRHNVAVGLYGATYTQDNRWYFTDILTDVRDQPRFLDVIAVSGADTVHVTRNGFRRFLSNYTNGTGQASIFSAVLGGSIQLLERLRADLGVRYEYNNFVQSSENTSTVDLDGDTLTKYDIEPFGNGSFRHFDRSLDDWAGSVGLNYTLTDEVSFYAAGSRGYKMPALDEFLNARSDAQVALFDSRRTYSAEGGVKYASPRFGATVNGFYTKLKNVTGQGAVTDPVTGGTIWIITTNPEVQSYGTEVELSASPIEGLNLLGSGTWLQAEYATCPDTTGNPGAVPCPTGADVGSILLGVPEVIGNFSARYTLPGVGIGLLGDVHFVGSRTARVSVEGSRDELPAYAYVNFGASYDFPGQRITAQVDLLNAFQSKGLEELNPRLSLVGGRTSDFFLARPILPRRFVASLRYNF